jgi:hypothetical protein
VVLIVDEPLLALISFMAKNGFKVFSVNAGIQDDELLARHVFVTGDLQGFPQFSIINTAD